MLWQFPLLNCYFSCQKRRATLEHGQTGRDTFVYHLKSYDLQEFGILNRIPCTNVNQQHFYQLGEEGNGPEAYELHVTARMQRLIFRDFIISTTYPNNIVLVRGKGVCVVSKIHYNEEEDVFIATVAPMKIQRDFFHHIPCNSSVFDIYLVTGGSADVPHEIHSSEILNQYVCIMYDRRTKPSSIPGQPDELDKINSSWVCIPLMHSSLN